MTRPKKKSQAAPDPLTNWERVSPTLKSPRTKQSPDGPVEAERRRPGHFLLEKAIAELCATSKIIPLTSKHIDLLIQDSLVSFVFEMKVCDITDIGSHLRHAIYQLLEYRYLYRNVLRSEVRLCVVSDRRPRGGSEWIMGYLDHIRIGIIWRNDGDSGFSCSDFTKTLLGDVLPQVREWVPTPVMWK
jgi:hypothetical protein